MACFCRFINESIALEKRRKIVLTENFKLNFSLKNEYNNRKKSTQSPEKNRGFEKSLENSGLYKIQIKFNYIINYN